MDKNIITGWIVLLSLAAIAQAEVPRGRLNHVYLNYVSPFSFVEAFTKNARPYIFHPFRAKRSNDAYYSDNHHNMPMHQPIMPYSMSYNPMYNPFGMFHHSMAFPSLPRFNPMPYGYGYHPAAAPSYNAHFNHGYNNGYGNGYNGYNGNGYNNYGYNAAAHHKPAVHAPAPSHPFGNDFMKMMGFDFDKFPSIPKANFNYNNGDAKGNNYENSYSKSYSMNMDYANGKGHMVTKDSSYMNDNGNVEMHDNPAQHYSMGKDGHFVPDNSYNQH